MQSRGVAPWPLKHGKAWHTDMHQLARDDHTEGLSLLPAACLEGVPVGSRRNKANAPYEGLFGYSNSSGFPAFFWEDFFPSPEVGNIIPEFCSCFSLFLVGNIFPGNFGPNSQTSPYGIFFLSS
jgi:hypothetical protein